VGSQIVSAKTRLLGRSAEGGAVLVILSEMVNPEELADQLRAEGLAEEIEYIQPDFFIAYAGIGLTVTELDDRKRIAATHILWSPCQCASLGSGVMNKGRQNVVLELEEVRNIPLIHIAQQPNSIVFVAILDKSIASKFSNFGSVNHR